MSRKVNRETYFHRLRLICQLLAVNAACEDLWNKIVPPLFCYLPTNCVRITRTPVFPRISPDDRIFRKMYDFNFDSSGLPETDLLRFAPDGLGIFDLYCESSFTFCRLGLTWKILRDI